MQQVRAEIMEVQLAKIGPPPGLEHMCMRAQVPNGTHQRHNADKVSDDVARLVEQVAALLTAKPVQPLPHDQTRRWIQKHGEHLPQRHKVPVKLPFPAGMTVSAQRGAEVGELSIGEVSTDASLSDDECTAQLKTTMMLRDIPPMLSREMLINLLDQLGFWGTYDFVYIPVDHSTRRGFGYAFVNFSLPETALHFRRHFEGYNQWPVLHDKPCAVVWSEAHQGLEEHIERLRNSTVMHDSVPEMFKPVLFRGGMRIPFPAPTKRPRAPRIRRQASDNVPQLF